MLAMIEFPERLRTLRESRGWSRRETSLRAGLSASMCGQIERGDIACPGTDTVAAFARAFDIDAGWFFTDAPPPESESQPAA